ncbi:MAG: ABC transporter permease [Candidatus Promineifilaceae bacterium]
MWNRITNIWRKELTDSLRDRRALRQALMMPIVLGVFYALLNPILGSVFEGQIEQQAQEAAVVTTIGSDNISEGLDLVLSSALIRLDEWSGTRAELETLIESGELSVALVVPAGFVDAVDGENSAEIELLLNTGGNAFDIDTTTRRLQGALGAYGDQLVTQRLTERGIDPAILNPIQIESVVLTTPAQQGGAQASFLLPILLSVVVVTGGMFIAIDVTAGEKERGTLESLLLTPASDAEIFIGKLLAVFTMTNIPLILTFAGYGITSALLPESLSKGAVVPAGVIIGSILVALPLAFAVNVILMIMAIRTKTFKDAQSAAAPITMLTMFPAMASGFFPPSSAVWYLIPAYGTGAVAGKLAVDGSIPMMEFGVTIISCLVLAGIGIVIGLRLFDRERLLYSM